MTQSIKRIPTSTLHRLMQTVMYIFSVSLLGAATISIYMYTVWKTALPEALKNPGGRVWFLTAPEMSELLFFLPLLIFVTLLIGIICFSQALQFYQPIYKIDHDAQMVEMIGLMQITIERILNGNFDKYASLLQITYIMEDIKQSWPKLNDKTIEMLAAVAFIASSQIRPALLELQTLERSIQIQANSQAEVEAGVALIRSKIDELYPHIQRLLVLRDNNQREYSGARAQLEQMVIDLNKLAPLTSGNVLNFPQSNPNAGSN